MFLRSCVLTALFISVVFGASFNQAPKRSSWTPRPSGASANDRFGWSVAFFDGDRDGRIDAAVGAPEAGSGGQGKVYWFKNSGSTFPNSFTSNLPGSSNNHLGYGLRGGAMLGGTENDDLWVGAAYSANSRIVQGPFSTAVPSNIRQYSTGTGSKMSAHEGDFDNDGTPDIAMGSTFTNGGRVSMGGSTSLRSYSSTLSGSRFLGWTSCAGDFNNDGFDDVVFCDPQREQQLTKGGCQMHAGGSGGPSSSASWEYEHGVTGAHFGWSCAAVDLDNDGFDELLVGVPGGTATSFKGNVAIFKGSASGLPASPNGFIDGVSDNDEFGYCIRPAGDLDKDGYPDAIVGAPFAGDNREGAISAVYGAAGGFEPTLRWVAYGTQKNSGFGMSVDGGYDIDGDTVPDVLVGAPFHDVDGEKDLVKQAKGFAFLMLGRKLCDLGITLTTDVSGAVLAGSEFRATVTVTNTGRATAETASFLMSLPEGIDVVDSGPEDTYTCSSVSGVGSQHRCSIGNLAVGASKTVILRYIISSTATGDIAGTATADSVTVDLEDDNNQASLAFSVSAVTNLALTVRQQKEIAVADTNQEYYIETYNEGPSASVNTVVTVTLPTPTEGAIYVTYRANFLDEDGSIGRNQGSCAPGTGSSVYDCSIGTLPALITHRITIVVKVDGAIGNTLTTSATVTTTTSGNDVSDDSGSVTCTIGESADVATTFVVISNYVDDTYVIQNGIVYYSISVTNLGPSTAENVVHTFTLDSRLSIASTSMPDTCTPTDNIITCNFGTMVAGTDYKVNVDALVSPGAEPGNLVTTASSTTSSVDGAPANNDKTINFELRGLVDLDVLILPSNVRPIPGRRPLLFFTITARNAGPSIARNAQIRFEIPDARLNADDVETVSFAGGASYNYTFENDPNNFGLVRRKDAANLTATIPAIAVGGTLTMTVTVDVPVTVRDGFTAIAVVSPGSLTDVDWDNNFAETEEVIPTIVTDCDLSVYVDAGSVNPTRYVPTGEFTYEATVSNVPGPRRPVTAFDAFVEIVRPSRDMVSITEVIITPVTTIKSPGAAPSVTEGEPIYCEPWTDFVPAGPNGNNTNSSQPDEEEVRGMEQQGFSSRSLLVMADVGLPDYDSILCTLGDVPVSPYVQSNSEVVITVKVLVKGPISDTVPIGTAGNMTVRVNVLDPMVDYDMGNNEISYDWTIVESVDAVVTDEQVEPASNKAGSFALAVIIPLLVVCCCSVIAWRLGFFKRKRPPKMDEEDEDAFEDDAVDMGAAN